MTLALLISLLVHTLLLSLTFGEGPGLPGIGFPWRERRVEAPDLRVVLIPAQDTSAEPTGPPAKVPPQQASIKRPVVGALVLSPAVEPKPSPGRTAAANVPKAKRVERAKPTAEAKPVPKAATSAAPANAPLHTRRSGDAAPTPIPAPEVLAMKRPDEAALSAPAGHSAPEPVVAAAPSAPTPETGVVAPERIDPEIRARAVEPAKPDRSESETQRQAAELEAARIETARQEAAREEAERAERARLEAERQEAARQAAARQEVVRAAAAVQEIERREAARREAERLETARQEAGRQEITRQAAARQEAARQEAERIETARLEVERQQAARQEAARRQALRQEAERVEAARLEAERQEAERQAAVRQEAARQEASRLGAEQEEARREARLRAIGRQLDEEAARREAAAKTAGPPSRPLPSSSGARRGRLFGRTDPDVELVLYAEAWARKIELNMTFDMVREAAKRPHTNPLVTVAIRSDGSVESVTFVTSSGVKEIDEAVRRIVESQVPYQAFPPGLAREYDVIEIRRTWHFDVAVRLY